MEMMENGFPGVTVEPTEIVRQSAMLRIKNFQYSECAFAIAKSTIATATKNGATTLMTNQRILKSISPQSASDT